MHKNYKTAVKVLESDVRRHHTELLTKLLTHVFTVNYSSTKTPIDSIYSTNTNVNSQSGIMYKKSNSGLYAMIFLSPLPLHTSLAHPGPAWWSPKSALRGRHYVAFNENLHKSQKLADTVFRMRNIRSDWSPKDRLRLWNTELEVQNPLENQQADWCGAFKISCSVTQSVDSIFVGGIVRWSTLRWRLVCSPELIWDKAGLQWLETHLL